MAKMPDMSKVMKVAQDMKRKMEEQMEAIEVVGNAGGGMVKVTMNGHKNVLATEISAEVVDPDDIEMLQDLITAAVNDAIAKVDDEMNDNLGGMMGGLGIPGGFPFPGM